MYTTQGTLCKPATPQCPQKTPHNASNSGQHGNKHELGTGRGQGQGRHAAALASDSFLCACEFNELVRMERLADRVLPNNGMSPMIMTPVQTDRQTYRQTRADKVSKLNDLMCFASSSLYTLG